VLAIARRELGQLLATPAGWLLAAGTHSVLAWWFLTLVERYRSEYEGVLVRTQSQLGTGDLLVAPFLGGLPVLAMLIVTAASLGVRAIAEERRQATLQLLLGSHRYTPTIVGGKYAGNLAFLTLIIGLWSLMPWSLMLFTDMNAGRLAASLLGLWLVGATLLALSLFSATLSRQTGVASILAFSLGLLLMLTGRADDAVVTRWLNLTDHYRDFLEGIVASADLAYFGVLTVGGLALSTWRLRALRQA